MNQNGINLMIVLYGLQKSIRAQSLLVELSRVCK